MADKLPPTPMPAADHVPPSSLPVDRRRPPVGALPLPLAAAAAVDDPTSAPSGAAHRPAPAGGDARAMDRPPASDQAPAAPMSRGGPVGDADSDGGVDVIAAAASGYGRNDVFLSLRDPAYKSTMFARFRDLDDDAGRGGEARLASELHREFKSGGGRFYKSLGRTGGGYVEVTEKEAYEKIRADVRRRDESAKKWRTNASSATANGNGGGYDAKKPIPRKNKPRGAGGAANSSSAAVAHAASTPASTSEARAPAEEPFRSSLCQPNDAKAPAESTSAAPSRAHGEGGVPPVSATEKTPVKFRSELYRRARCPASAEGSVDAVVVGGYGSAKAPVPPSKRAFADATKDGDGILTQRIPKKARVQHSANGGGGEPRFGPESPGTRSSPLDGSAAAPVAQKRGRGRPRKTMKAARERPAASISTHETNEDRSGTYWQCPECKREFDFKFRNTRNASIHNHMKSHGVKPPGAKERAGAERTPPAARSSSRLAAVASPASSSTGDGDRANAVLVETCKEVHSNKDGSVFEVTFDEATTFHDGAAPSRQEAPVQKRGRGRPRGTKNKRGGARWGKRKKDSVVTPTPSGARARVAFSTPKVESSRSRSTKLSFPLKLHQLVSYATENNPDVMRWTDAGDEFLVLDTEGPMKALIGMFFGHSNWASLYKSMFNWGWTRSNPSNEAQKVYYRDGFARASTLAELRCINNHRSGPKPFQSIPKRKAGTACSEVRGSTASTGEASSEGAPTATREKRRSFANACSKIMSVTSEVQDSLDEDSDVEDSTVDVAKAKRIKVPIGKRAHSEPAPEIGFGWTKLLVKRPKGERVDRTYISPEGLKFRSLREVNCYLNSNSGGGRAGGEDKENSLENDSEKDDVSVEEGDSDDEMSSVESAAPRRSNLPEKAVLSISMGEIQSVEVSRDYDALDNSFAWSPINLRSPVLSSNTQQPNDVASCGITEPGSLPASNLLPGCSSFSQAMIDNTGLPDAQQRPVFSPVSVPTTMYSRSLFEEVPTAEDMAHFSWHSQYSLDSSRDGHQETLQGDAF